MAVVLGIAGGKRAEMLAWFSSVTIIGNLLGAPLGGFMLTWLSAGQEPSLAHFHIIYGVVAAFGMASLLIALWVMQGKWDSPKHENGHSESSVTQFRPAFGKSLWIKSPAHQQCGGVPKPIGRRIGSVSSDLCGGHLRILGLPSRVALGNTNCRYHSLEAPHGKDLGSAWSS
jgi:MFS family permease